MIFKKDRTERGLWAAQYYKYKSYSYVSWCYLGEHGLAVLGDHGGLVAVQAHHRLVEGLLGVPQLPVQLRHAALQPIRSQY